VKRPAAIIPFLLSLVACAGVSSHAELPLPLEHRSSAPPRAAGDAHAPVSVQEPERGHEGPYRSVRIQQLRIMTPYTIERGGTEVALVPSYLDYGTARVGQFVTELEFGLLDSLLAEAEIPFNAIDVDGQPSHAGLGDLAFALKYQFPRLEALDLHSAVGAELSVPTGDEDRGLGAGDPGGAMFVALQRDIDRWSFVTDFVIEVQRHESPRYGWDGAAVFRPGEAPLYTMLGLNVEWEPSGESGTSLVPGLEYELDDVSLGLGVPIGLNEEAQDFGVILLVEFEL